MAETKLQQTSYNASDGTQPTTTPLHWNGIFKSKLAVEMTLQVVNEQMKCTKQILQSTKERGRDRGKRKSKAGLPWFW